MRKTTKSPGEKVVKDIKRATGKHFSSKEKIRIVPSGLRGEDSIAELCRREGISQGIYCKWSKDFTEAGKKRLAGDTARVFPLILYLSLVGLALYLLVQFTQRKVVFWHEERVGSYDDPAAFGLGDFRENATRIFDEMRASQPLPAHDPERLLAEGKTAAAHARAVRGLDLKPALRRDLDAFRSEYGFDTTLT